MDTLVPESTTENIPALAAVLNFSAHAKVNSVRTTSTADSAVVGKVWPVTGESSHIVTHPCFDISYSSCKASTCITGTHARVVIFGIPSCSSMCFILAF